MMSEQSDAESMPYSKIKFNCQNSPKWRWYQFL